MYLYLESLKYINNIPENEHVISKVFTLFIYRAFSLNCKNLIKAFNKRPIFFSILIEVHDKIMDEYSKKALSTCLFHHHIYTIIGGHFLQEIYYLFIEQYRI